MKTKRIKLVIRPQTVKEEFDYLWYTLEQLPFFKKNNYTVELPSHPVFLELALRSSKFDKIDKTSLFDLFKKEIYDLNFFKQGLITIESYRPMFDMAISRFIEMNKEWGFKIFPKYTIALTRYGPGGSYDAHKGMVILMASISGTFKKFHPAITVIHEMVHMGIEENIVNHFILDHWEKEELVDMICALKFGDIWPNYQKQQSGNKKIDSYINSESIKDLPKAIEKYVINFPRK